MVSRVRHSLKPVGGKMVSYRSSHTSTLLVCLVFLNLSLQNGVLGSVETGGGGKTPEGKRQIKVMSGFENENIQFQEELRSAMSSHWEILQNIRYHTLMSKMKVAQLDKKVKELAQHIGSMDDAKTMTSPEVPCDEDQKVPEPGDKNVPEPGDEQPRENQRNIKNEMATVLTSLKELSQFYESFNYTTTNTFDPPMGIEGGFEKLMQVLEKLKTLAGRKFQVDPGKRLTRKSTKVLNATLMPSTATTVTTSMMTTTTTQSEGGSGPLIRDFLHTDNITFPQGTTASLRCRVIKKGTATVVWTKSNPFGGFDILTAGQYVYSSDQRHGITIDEARDSTDWILTIKEVTSRDQGMYRCEVNSVPSISKNIHLIVQEEAPPTIVVSQTNDVSAVIGATASLNCRVTNLGLSAVSWRGTDHYGNSVLLTYNENSYASDPRIGVVHHQGSQDWALTIQNIANVDEGVYTCVVNSNPGLSHAVSLTVYESEPLSTSRPSPEINVTLHGGSSYTFNCTADTSDSEQVFWMREEDQHIFTDEQSVSHSDHRLSTSHDSESSWSLTIGDINTSDEGTYKCLRSSASNQSADLDLLQTVHLSVDMRPFIAPDNSDSVTAETGSTASLHCRVSHLGMYTVSWTRRNANGSMAILTVGHFTFIWNTRFSVALDAALNDWVLKIRDVDPTDAGEYQCQISTRPVISHSVTLDIMDSEPRAEDIPSSHKSHITVREGDAALLTCHVQDLGDSSVSWVRSSDFQVLTAGEFSLSLDARFQANTQDNETWNLQIADIRKEDEGEYLCQVSTDPVTSNTFWVTVNANPPSTSSAERLETSVAFTTAVAAPSCVDPFEMISGDLCLYLVTQQKLSWMDASHFCRSQGGELAIELDGSIRSFLEQKHGEEGEHWTMWPFWIGAREERTQTGERVWRWLDGNVVDSSFWATNQPRKYGKRKAPQGSCVTLDAYEGYAGVAIPCQYRRRFVCFKQ